MRLIWVFQISLFTLLGWELGDVAAKSLGFGVESYQTAKALLALWFLFIARSIERLSNGR